MKGTRNAVLSGMRFEWLRDRSRVFGRDIVRFCRNLPRDESTRRLAGQLQNAGTSVAANYHAACRARSHAEFIAKIGTVVEETDEATLWLRTMKDAEVTRGAELERLLLEAHELRAIFARSQSTAIRNDPRRKKRSPPNDSNSE